MGDTTDAKRTDEEDGAIETVHYQARAAAKNRPCKQNPCGHEFPGMPSRWCSGCLIAALLVRLGGAKRRLRALIDAADDAIQKGYEENWLHYNGTDESRLQALEDALRAVDVDRED